MSVQIHCCAHCGEYRFIEEGGYCRSCADDVLYEVRVVNMKASVLSSYDLDQINIALREDERFKTEEVGPAGDIKTRVWMNPDSWIDFRSLCCVDRGLVVSWYHPPMEDGEAAVNKVRKLFNTHLPASLVEDLSSVGIKMTISFEGSIDTKERFVVFAIDNALPIDVSLSSFTFHSNSNVKCEIESLSPVCIRFDAPDKETAVSAWRDAQMTDAVLSMIEESS